MRNITKALALGGLLLMTSPVKAEKVLSSWYDYGPLTANGEKFDKNSLTAAHKTLPFGTLLRVTYKDKSIVVRINDRGPFIRGRTLDLTIGAARQIGCVEIGLCWVDIEIVGKVDPPVKKK
ncbi:MAG: septal ring lytic transglycosylase RlpA family protein [bacterium]